MKNINQYSYCVVAENNSTGKRLAESFIMKMFSLFRNYHSICIWLYFNMESDVEFDKINFKIMRTSESKFRPEHNVQLITDFDNCISRMISIQEEERKFTEFESIELHNTFSHIKTYINNHILIDKFNKKERIEFISEKINILLTELIFLTKEELISIKEDLVYCLIIIYSFAESSESFELMNNVKQLIELNYDGNLVQAKNDLLNC